MKIFNWLNRAYREYLRRKYLQRAVQFMAVIVVFCTTYALILPAITLESGTVCGFSEHTHTDKCYEMVEPTECTIPESEEHVHTDQCYEAGEPVECTIPESEGHTHTEECYRETSVLTCTLPEAEAHTHTDGCIEIQYTQIPAESSANTESTEDTAADNQEAQADVQFIETTHYICGKEETEGHTHGEGCYTTGKELTCGKEEAAGHKHSDSCCTTGKKLVCGLEETLGHSHQEDSMEPVARLVCDVVEHTHSESCYPVTEPVLVEETAPESADLTADLETAADWEATLSAVTLTGDWSYDLLAISQTQLGYRESKINYITEEDGTICGYTRYGQWYGDFYGDWSAMFVSFCLHYAEVEGIDPQQDCEQWRTNLNEAGIYYCADAYSPVPGDIIFLDWNEDGMADQVGIVEIATDETQNSFSTCQIIAGDCDGQVDRKVLEADYHIVLGYAALPTEPVKEFHLHSAEDGTMTQVYLGEDTTVPGSALLNVTALEESDEKHAAMAEQVRQAIPDAVSQVTLLDISFFDAAGNYLPVSETATVSICYPSDALRSGQVKVFHFVDGVPVELTRVNCEPIAMLSMEDDSPAQTMLTFQTEGFSVFAVVNVFEDATRITLTDPVTLNGNAYYIVSNNNNWCMSDTPINNMGLKMDDYSDLASLSDKTIWTFLMQPDGTFKIRSDGGKYLVMEDSDVDVAGMWTTTDEAAATSFTIQAVNRQAEIGYDGPNGKAHYLNAYQENTDFRGWHQRGDGSKVHLHVAETSDGVHQTVSGLGGKEFAIVSNATYGGYNKALAATAVTVNSVTGLTTTDTTLTTIEGAQRVNGEVQLWMFEATDAEGVYKISTQIDGQTKYLRLLDQDEDSNNPDGRGSLTLGDEPQEITAIANSDGTISLRASVNGQTGYVNLDTKAFNYWTYSANADSSKLLLAQELDTVSSFPIVYNDQFTITVVCTDASGNRLSINPETKVLDNDSKPFSDYAPVIDGYRFSHAVYNNANNATVVSIGPVDETRCRMYGLTYTPDSGSNDFYTINVDTTVTLIYTNAKALLNYDLRLPDNSWVDVTPRIPSNIQEVTTEDALYEVTGIDVAGTNKYVANTAEDSEEIVDYYKALNNAKGDALTAENYMAPGSEYLFLGWQVNTTDGQTVTLVPDSELTVNEDGTVSVHSGENTYMLGDGTTLTGQWQKVNDLIQLFVNFKSTMLSTQSSVTVDTNSDHYTENMAFGRIYNAYDKSNTNASKDNHELFAGHFVNTYDPASSECQIVLDAVYVHGTTVTSGQYVAVNGADGDAVSEYVMHYIQTNPNTSRQIEVDGIKIDQSSINAENYGLYWYSMKYVTTGGRDAYHMDGILIANTEPIYIRKTFSGLTDSEVTSLKSTMQFPVYVYDAQHNKQPYKTLEPNVSLPGIFEYVDQLGTQNIFTWKLNAIQDQKYAFSETNYALDGHDCATLLSVQFLDPGKPTRYRYYTDNTYSDPDVFGELEGGDVSQVVFANFYTKTGTGMFTISKTSSVDSSVRLPGAKFSLTNEDGDYYTFDSSTGSVTWTDKQADPVIYTTNSYGSIHFCDLEAGTYTLEEVAAPDGYLGTGKTWTVNVQITDGSAAVDITDNTTNVTTKVYETPRDDVESDTTVQLVYQIDNTPVTDTLQVTTAFSLTEEEFAAIKDNYTITLTKAGGTDTRTLRVTDSNAMKNQDGSYSWLLQNMVGEYTVTQTGLAHGSYKDVVSNVKLNDETLSQNGSGQYDLTLGEGVVDSLHLTNTYINNFTLRVNKVNESGTALAGAEFDLYTPNQYESPGGEVLTYTRDGATHRVYKLGTLAATDAAGSTRYSALRLNVNYVLVERVAPEGYVRLDDPIVLNNWDTEYSGGGYTTTVVNTDKVNVTAKIRWEVPETITPPDSVTLTLYRSNGTTTERVDTAPSAKTGDDGLEYTWEGLDKDYTYYVLQDEIPGYVTTYSTGTQQLTTSDSQVYAAPATEGTERNRTVTVTNAIGYELPETGGSGTGWHISLGLMLMLAGCCLYPLGTISKKRQGGLK